MSYYRDYEDEYDMDINDDFYMSEPFADPHGHSALRAGPRVYPCPTCKQPNRLSAADVRHGYQCDECADKAEGRGWCY
jgi:DNA-directed RNA polymerase subunit RPC12/RpoP